MRYFLIIVLLLLFSIPTFAHDPHIEHEDWGSFDDPRLIEDDEISYAFYGYLDEDDVDVFQVEFDEPQSLLRIELLVPECGDHYTDFFPHFAVVAPGYQSDIELPMEIPDEYGVLFYEAPETGERETFVEPFGGTTFYEAPRHDLTVPEAKTYLVVLFDPIGSTGDYALAIGYEERFESPAIQMIQNVITIRSDRWLHRDCTLESE